MSENQSVNINLLGVLPTIFDGAMYGDCAMVMDQCTEPEAIAWVLDGVLPTR